MITHKLESMMIMQRKKLPLIRHCDELCNTATEVRTIEDRLPDDTYSFKELNTVHTIIFIVWYRNISDFPNKSFGNYSAARHLGEKKLQMRYVYYWTVTA